MPNLVIVAIPREDDPVWKYSSEKVPHCTLLFLGENQAKANEIAAFLEHATSLWDRGPFGLSVDYRGTLGDDEADVLFFRKDWATKELASFRSTLLKNNAIRDAYDSTTQFPEWNPHLTMGYPSTPAKKDDRDYPGFHWVEFDRIALWTGDFEGPEFRMEYNYDLESEVMMTAAQKAIADVLEHHGVKGMKWGVRKAVRGSDSKGRSRFNANFQKEEGRGQLADTVHLIGGVVVPVIAPFAIPAAIRTGSRIKEGAGRDRAERQDHKFSKKVNDHRAMIEVHNKAVPDLNKNQKAINAKYKGVNLTDPKNAAKQRKYTQETMDMMAKTYQKHANATTSPTGRLQYDVERHGDNIKVVVKKVKHADGEEDAGLVLVPVLSDSGHIVNLKLDELKLDELKQAEKFVENFLAHHGVKGMKWGVRRDRTTVGSVHARTLTDKAKVKTTGGTGHNAHGDAVKAAKTKQKIKKSGTASASNKELQELIERARLETQARDAVASKGKKFVKKKLGQQIDQGVNQEIQRTIRKQREGR